MINKDSSRSVKAGGVDEYIANCPAEVHDKLEEIRMTIRKTLPDAMETVSYFDMPGYSYEGYDYNGMVAWFSYKAPLIRLHVRPPVLQDHEDKLSGYRKTKSIVSFKQDEKIPTVLVQRLVRASLAAMKKAAQ